MTSMRLNHAVLYVRDATRTANWFCDHLDFTVAHELPGAAFLRCADSPNDHDLAFFSVGASAGASVAGRGQVGMYHLAWEVPTLGRLAELRARMAAVGAIVGQSDHTMSKSIYCTDPDGLEFELMWAVPVELLDDDADGTAVLPLDLDAEIERYGPDTPGRVTFRPPVADPRR